MSRRLVLIAAMAALVLSVSSAVLAGPPLGPDCSRVLGGPSGPSQVFGINDAGTAVGIRNSEAVVWDGVETRPLAGLAVASDINNLNQVVGWAWNNGRREAAMWHDGELTFLGTLGGSSFAFAINDQSQVVGYFEDASNWRLIHAFVWDAGEMRRLEELPGGLRSAASDINEAGQVVGWVESSVSRDIRAALWDQDGLNDLGTMDGDYAVAEAINNRGEIVGAWRTEATGSPFTPFVWSDGVRRDLAVPVGGGGSAQHINDHGEIVGQMSSPSEQPRATLWSSRGAVIDLGQPGFGSQAAAISKMGVIAGEGNTDQGVQGFISNCGPSAKRR